MYVERTEAQIGGFDTQELRDIINAAYEKLTQTMFESLQHMAKMADSNTEKYKKYEERMSMNAIKKDRVTIERLAKEKGISLEDARRMVLPDDSYPIPTGDLDPDLGHSEDDDQGKLVSMVGDSSALADQLPGLSSEEEPASSQDSGQGSRG